MSNEKDLTMSNKLEPIDLVTLQRDLYKIENAKLNIQILELNMKVAQLEVQTRKKDLKSTLDASQSKYEAGLKSLCDRYCIDLSGGDEINVEAGVITRAPMEEEGGSDVETEE